MSGGGDDAHWVCGGCGIHDAFGGGGGGEEEEEGRASVG